MRKFIELLESENKLSNDELISLYKKEYSRVNGKEIKISYSKGWFNISLDGTNTDKYRKENLIKMIDALKQRKPNKKLNEMAKRTSPEEFIDLVRQAAPNQSDFSLADLNKIAADNDVQIPGAIRHNADYKNGPHLWNFGSKDTFNTDKPELSSTLGDDVTGDVNDSGEEYKTAIGLSKAKAKEFTNLVNKGKIYVMGRKPKGAFFRVPGMEQIAAQIERMIQHQEELGSGEATMEEQYEDLKEKVTLVASGRSTFIRSLLITGAPSAGKALALDTPIPTPVGWTTMGELKVGDTIFDDQGKPCIVTFATPIQYNRECFEVKFDDGTTIIADAEHRWLTTTNSSRYSESRHKRIWENRIEGEIKSKGNDQSYKRTFPSVVNTRQILDTLKVHGKYNHQIVNTKPLNGNNTELSINPYLLGLWLGDGTCGFASMTCGKQDLEAITSIFNSENIPFTVHKDKKCFRIQLSDGNKKKKLSEHLRGKISALGVLNNKHIPNNYLRANEENRLSLLQGLMDSDGTIDKQGRCEFSVTNEKLARDVYELICSLGIKVGFTVGKAKLKGIVIGDRYRLNFTTTLPIFKLERKLSRLPKTIKRNTHSRTIVAVNHIPSVPVRCITVDSPSHLFLCSKAFIPTHNTYNVIKTLKELGLNEGSGYTKKTGKIAVTALYRTLLQKKDGLILFDDCDSVVSDEDGVNILKGALDTGDYREISYDNKLMIDVDGFDTEKRIEYTDRLSRLLNDGEFTKEDYDFFLPICERNGMKMKKKKKSDFDSEDETDEDDFEDDSGNVLAFITRRLPNKFSFGGRVIFISNLDEDDWDSAILSRAFRVQMNFKSIEMLDFIDKIKDNIKASISDEEKQEVMDYIRELWTLGKLKSPVNFRLVQAAFDLRLVPNWKRMLGNL